MKQTSRGASTFHLVPLYLVVGMKLWMSSELGAPRGRRESALIRVCFNFLRVRVLYVRRKRAYLGCLSCSASRKKNYVVQEREPSRGL
eukprot:10422740-Ditylum_brightwellii.AAC.1